MMPRIEKRGVVSNLWSRALPPRMKAVAVMAVENPTCRAIFSTLAFGIISFLGFILEIVRGILSKLGQNVNTFRIFLGLFGTKKPL
jgi:hypothetical protein